MGYAVPAAIGAALANPGRDVVALAGDGAFLMTGLELMTAVAYGAGVVVCLLRDGELAQIAQFQRTALAEAANSVAAAVRRRGIRADHRRGLRDVRARRRTRGRAARGIRHRARRPAGARRGRDRLLPEDPLHPRRRDHHVLAPSVAGPPAMLGRAASRHLARSGSGARRSGRRGLTSGSRQPGPPGPPLPRRRRPSQLLQSHSRPSASPNPESRIPNPECYASPCTSPTAS